MNKLFTKIASLCVGLAMAVGVGVAVGSKSSAPREARAATYTKVSSLSDLSNDDVVVVATLSNSAPVKGVSGQSGTKDAAVSTTESDWVQYIVKSKNNSGFKLYDSTAELYIASANSSKEFTYSASGDTLTVGNGADSTTGVLYNSGGRFLGENSSNHRWYATSNLSSYPNFYVFKVNQAKTPKSLALSGTYQTAFTVGDTFTHQGMTVTVTYTDDTTGDVSSSATFSGYNMSSAGNQTVTVSYTENNTPVSTTYSITVSEPVAATGISINKESTSIEQGGSETLTATVTPADAADKTVSWSISPAEQGVSVSNGTVTAISSAVPGDYVVTATANGGNNVTDTCTVTVSKASSITDKLTRSSTGISSGGGYGDWDDVSASSSARYAGNSAGANDSIQLRKSSSTQDESAIVSTTSGGKISKVTVEWNSNTQADRTLNVYVKATAYIGPADLYDNTKCGTLFGTIVKGTSTELTITGDYAYVGVVSNSGAMYLDSISFVWAQEEEPTSELTSIEITLDTESLKTDYWVGEEISLEGVDIIAHYTDSADDHSVKTSQSLTLVYDTIATENMDTVTIMAEYEGEEDQAEFEVNVSQDYVTSLTWSGWNASQFDVFEGDELTSSIISGWTIKANWASQKPATTLSYGTDYKFSTPLGDILSLPYHWRVGDTRLTAVYLNDMTKITYKTMTITPRLNSVKATVSGEFSIENFISTATVTAEGTNGGSGGQASANQNGITISSQGGYFGASPWKFYSGKDFTVSSTKTIKTINLTFSGSYDGLDSSYSINDTSFVATTSKQTRVTCIEIIYQDTQEVEIANDPDYKVAQRAVVEFANTFNSDLEKICVSYGETDPDDLENKWDELSSTFTSWFINSGKSLENEQKTRAKALFANARYTTRESASNDPLQAMLGKYDEILSHYDFDDFLKDDSGRGAAPQKAGRLTPMMMNDSSIIAVAIITSISGLAVAGYLFLRRRKEQ